MSCILNIETSTDVCSVALSQDGVCIFEKANYEGMNHAKSLATFADEAVSFADSHAIPLDAMAVSKGPGSYTGLRIGVSTAKGICYGRGIKMIAIPTLKLLCVPVLLGEVGNTLPDDALLCPMIDARRMEVYAALYDRALNEVRPTQADIVDGETYREYLEAHPVWFFGNGEGKCDKLLLEHHNAHTLKNIRPLAKNMMPLSEKAMAEGDFVDVAYFEPYYLKDFITTKPKNLLNGI